MSALNVDSAIGAHLAWKRRLEYTILGLDKADLDVDTVCDDTRCLLGLWLNGEGRRHQAWQSYARLFERHKRFHQVACQVVTLARERDTEGALALLNGEFDDLSGEVVELLTSLRNHLNATDAGRQDGSE
ncbi:MAG TPA: CZB domain-containing protein [Rhodocyclaceae bacterium]|nr:CZB domain-containing protein [Rhodocyclaceae bacterium]HNH35696.1 CZB domain-containing protein [Rhodocyclaceae bacterium]